MGKITYVDRTNSTAPTGATDEASAAIYNEIKTVVNENFDLLFLGYPSEAQFSMNDNISVAVIGFVSQDEIISIANSILNED